MYKCIKACGSGITTYKEGNEILDETYSVLPFAIKSCFRKKESEEQPTNSEVMDAFNPSEAVMQSPNFISVDMGFLPEPKEDKVEFQGGEFGGAGASESYEAPINDSYDAGSSDSGCGDSGGGGE